MHVIDTCPKLWSFVVVSSAISPNLYLLPVALCGFVQKIAASEPQFA